MVLKRSNKDLKNEIEIGSWKGLRFKRIYETQTGKTKYQVTTHIGPEFVVQRGFLFIGWRWEAKLCGVFNPPWMKGFTFFKKSAIKMANHFSILLWEEWEKSREEDKSVLG